MKSHSEVLQDHRAVIRYTVVTTAIESCLYTYLLDLPLSIFNDSCYWCLYLYTVCNWMNIVIIKREILTPRIFSITAYGCSSLVSFDLLFLLSLSNSSSRFINQKLGSAYLFRLCRSQEGKKLMSPSERVLKNKFITYFEMSCKFVVDSNRLYFTFFFLHCFVVILKWIRWCN